jgi:hypothetical protein
LLKVIILFRSRFVAPFGPFCRVVLSEMRVQTRWYALSEARMDFEFDREQVPWGKVAKYFEKRVKRI